MWEQLRNRKLGGYKFRRQQIAEGFVVDFYCGKAKLVFEIDGGIHSTEAQKKIDEHRRKVFKLRGLLEIRFKNAEVEKDYNSVLEKIRNAIFNRIAHFK